MGGTELHRATLIAVREDKQSFFSLEIVMETCENHHRLYPANIIFILPLPQSVMMCRGREVEVVYLAVKRFYIDKNTVVSLRVDCRMFRALNITSVLIS